MKEIAEALTEAQILIEKIHNAFSDSRGIECERCHGYFCAKELGEYNGEYVCDDCRQEIEEEEAEEEEGGAR